MENAPYNLYQVKRFGTSKSYSLIAFGITDPLLLLSNDHNTVRTFAVANWMRTTVLYQNRRYFVH